MSNILNISSASPLPVTLGGLGLSTATTGDILYASASNTWAKLAAVAVGSILVSAGTGTAPAYSSAPSISTISVTGGGGSTTALTMGGSASAISGVTPVIDLSANYSDGNYLRFGTNAAIGLTSAGRPFLSRNLDYDGTTGSYKYMTTTFANAVEIATSGISFLTAPSGTAGNAVTPTTTMFVTGGSVSITGALTTTGSIFTENASAGSFQAKNTGGTYETWMYPRYNDNIMYQQYGSGGFILRNNSGTPTLTINGSDNSTLAGVLTLGTGDLFLNTAGKTITYKTGSNACAGSGAVMVAGAVTVSTTAVTTGSIITLMKTTNGGTTTIGAPAISIVNATSFTLTGGTLDTSTWSWIINKTN